ncbi:hypothetical protein AB0C38_48100 [Amycolatopsis sp. NPDC048633]|uniref:hypothetical protein n=1 Tax=Amycolatopsis sp. NPDC048633 TaxID=3157095 RepID=UPI0033CEB74E
MASPDTDELATVPTPSGAPDAESATEAEPQERAEPAAGPGAAEAVPPQQQTEPLAAEPSAEAQTVPQERVEPENIEPADTTSADASPEAEEPRKPGGRWWRGFTGSLAAGLAVLAIGVLAVAGIDLNTGAPGPGAVLLIGHPVAAILALLAQRVADRRNGVPAAGAGVAVVLFTVSALTLFWLT